jgi:NitT/TauT family transport system substrate-binding protein
MRPSSRSLAILFGGITALLLAGGCAPAAPAPTGASPPGPAAKAPAAAPAQAPAAAPAQRALLPVVVRQGWNSAGTNSPMFLAMEKGWYAEEGLDVSMPEGTGTNPVFQVIATGQEPMAVKMGAGAVALGISLGAPVTAVMLVYQKNPSSVFCRSEAGLKANGPRALVGKSVGGTAGDEGTVLMPAFLKANDVDPSQVQIVSLDAAARINTFLAGRLDCSIGYVNDTFVAVSTQATENGWQLDALPFADHGVPAMGDVVLANNDFIREHPQAVRGFVRATIKAYNYAKTNPDEAIAALIKAHPVLKPELEKAKLLATYPLMDTPLTQQYGYGYSEAAQWQNMQDVLAEYMGLTNRASDVSVYFTNEFLK